MRGFKNLKRCAKCCPKKENETTGIESWQAAGEPGGGEAGDADGEAGGKAGGCEAGSKAGGGEADRWRQLPARSIGSLGGRLLAGSASSDMVSSPQWRSGLAMIGLH